MTPTTAHAMRAALDARITAQARGLSIDAGRLRRRLVFQRILRRIGESDQWVLKGGYLLETRLGSGFRTTRDLDLAIASLAVGADIAEHVAEALSDDPDSDFFRFQTTGVAVLALDQAGRRGWRVSITAKVAGRPFDRVRLDIVERLQETHGGTGRLQVPVPVSGVGFDHAEVNAVDVAQHAAEKFHALCRTYGSDRPSTRVKDLVDLELMIESGLLPNERLTARLVAVFDARDRTSPPNDLPSPPASWTNDFDVLIAETSSAGSKIAEAFARARQIYRNALA